MIRSRILFVLLTTLVMIISLTACGSKTVKLNIEMKEFEFTPNAFELKAGAAADLQLKNSGALEHDFVILKAGYSATAPFDAKNKEVIYFEQRVPGMETLTASFTAPSEPGAYEIICSIPGHLEQHMTGMLTVTQ